MRFEYLVLVSSELNSNKFYKMTEKGDGSFRVEWGRVGANAQSTSYPMSQWGSKLNEKLGKGYTRVAGHGSMATQTVQASNVMIADDDVKDLVTFLIRSARQSISSNYLVSSESVTQVQIDWAQDIIGSLRDHVNQPDFNHNLINSLLEKLYRTIPRRMGNTKDYFVGSLVSRGDMVRLLQNEQSLLDTMQSQVGSSQHNSLDLVSLGLEIEVASQADRDRIASETDFRVSRQRIFKVGNKLTDDRFLKGRSKLLYHGSKNENWLSVLQRGLMIRPSGVSVTGSMFGSTCLYFADKAIKSIGYTSLRGSCWASGSAMKAYLALFDVNLGKRWGILDKQSYSSWMSGLDQERVNREGYDTVFARGGADLRNNEYMVYDQSRCTIRYLIELTV